MKTIKKMTIAFMLSASSILCYGQTDQDTTPAKELIPASTQNQTSGGMVDISGTYACVGNDPYSTPSQFKEKIVFKKNGDTYSVQMIHNNSVVPYNFGTGIISKHVPNVISFVYWDPKNTTTMGTELLEIKSDGSLSGVYADHNKMKVGTETCTKAS